MSTLRNWATPLTVATFLFMGVTGVLMFFHLKFAGSFVGALKLKEGGPASWQHEQIHRSRHCSRGVV